MKSLRSYARLTTTITSLFDEKESLADRGLLSGDGLPHPSNPRLQDLLTIAGIQRAVNELRS